MRIGAVYPQNELPAEAATVRAFASGLTATGFAHVMAYDHVLGADPEVHRDLTGPYTKDDTFHEPFVLFGYLAALTELEMVSGVLILPQRQTALVAKQAAAADVMSEGRLRLGVGIGWNHVEYAALGMDYHTRGRRIEEQIAVMRRLWTEPTVEIDARDHHIVGAGIAPLPVQQPIPLWLGATAAPRALQRVGRLADGWFPQDRPGPEVEEKLRVIREAAADAGRDPADIGVDARIRVGNGDVARMREEAAAWRELGATHLTLNSLHHGLERVEDHLRALDRAYAALA